MKGALDIFSRILLDNNPFKNIHCLFEHNSFDGRFLLPIVTMVGLSWDGQQLGTSG